MGLFVEKLGIPGPLFETRSGDFFIVASPDKKRQRNFGVRHKTPDCQYHGDCELPVAYKAWHDAALITDLAL